MERIMGDGKYRNMRGSSFGKKSNAIFNFSSPDVMQSGDGDGVKNEKLFK